MDEGEIRDSEWFQFLMMTRRGTSISGRLLCGLQMKERAGSSRI